jgi:hypothetical protein
MADRPQEWHAVAQLVIDYVIICERRRELLNFTDFIDLWREADAITRESGPGKNSVVG